MRVDQGQKVAFRRVFSSGGAGILLEKAIHAGGVLGLLEVALAGLVLWANYSLLREGK